MAAYATTYPYMFQFVIPLASGIVATVVGALFGRELCWFMSRSLIGMAAVTLVLIPLGFGPFQATVVGMLVIVFSTRDFTLVSVLLVAIAFFPDYVVAAEASSARTSLGVACSVVLFAIIAVSAFNLGARGAPQPVARS